MATDDHEVARLTLDDLFKCRLSEAREQEIRARVTWIGHKHGVILNVTTADQNDVDYWCSYHYGKKAGWWKKLAPGLWAVEFVYQGDGRVPKPWLWDGKTVLFQDWQEQEETNLARRRQFIEAGLKMGARVKFLFKGREMIGIYSGGQKYATIVTGGSKYYIVWDDIKAFSREAVVT